MHCRYAMGAAAAVLSAGVLVSWVIGWEAGVAVCAGCAPMQPNTATGLLLLGIGLGMPRASVDMRDAIGWLVALLGALTLVQYLASADLGIDRLLMDPWYTERTSAAGRPAPNTALAFLVAGVAMTRRRTEGLGAVVAILGAVPFVGYVVGAPEAYGWGKLTQMAVHTSVGLMLVGQSMVGHSWARRRAAGQRWSVDWWIAPALVGAIVVGALVLAALQTSVGAR